MQNQIGTLGRDKVTGFEGRATAYAMFENALPQYRLESKGLVEGKPIEPQWFDLHRIEWINTEAAGEAPGKAAAAPAETEGAVVRDLASEHAITLEREATLRYLHIVRSLAEGQLHAKLSAVINHIEQGVHTRF